MIFRYGFHRRARFGKFLTDRGLLGHAVEVGVHQGRFAAVLLNNWKGLYTGVDHYPENYDPEDPIKTDRQKDYEAALLALSNFSNRVSILRMPSLEASRDVRDYFLDFVYIDAKHRYSDVFADLTAWWPKVKPGGILAGHDIICPGMETLPGGGWGQEIQPALNDFFGAKDEVFLVTEDPTDCVEWSYYVQKR